MVRNRNWTPSVNTPLFTDFAHVNRYPQYFKAGDVCRLVLSQEILATKPLDQNDKRAMEDYQEYPLADYHKRLVRVVASKRDRDVRTAWPDDEGLVDCHLPYPFVQVVHYKDASGKDRTRKQTIVQLLILWSALEIVERS